MVKKPRFFIQMPVSIEERKDLSSTEKIIYSEIYTILNVTNKFYMSNKTLSKRTGSSKRTVVNSINKLKSLGLIATKQTYYQGSRKINGRLIYFPGSENNSPLAVKKFHGGSENNSPLAVKKFHPNILVNKSLNRPSNKSNSKTAHDIPKFSRICRYYDQELMINRLTASQTRWLIRDAKDWSKKFSLKMIEQAINTAHNVDLKRNLHNPVPYIDRILANDEYHKRNEQAEKQPMDYQNHQQFLADDRKQQQEAVAHMKKIGLI